MTTADMATAHPARVDVDAVTKVYGDGPMARLVVEECSFTAAAGQVTTVVGPSGCGKSTLAFLVAGYERATRGDVRTDGVPVTGPSHERLVVFQESALLPWLTTRENVMFGPRARGEDTRAARTRADALLDRVGLRGFADKYPGQLSGGMQRRAELARALINGPRVLILDDPFRGLDDMTRGLMQEYLSALVDGSTRTTLFVTTEIDEAIFLADRIVILSNIPAGVREVIDVDLTRPRRRAATLTDPRAFQIKERALAVLHDEAMRSFTPDEKEFTRP